MPSFTVVLKLVTKAEEINRKLSHGKSRLSICSGTYNLAVQFMAGLKSVWKLEDSFSSTLLFYFIFIACVLLEIGHDKLGSVESYDP